MPILRSVLFAVALVSLVACESAEDKYTRLDQERAAACLVAQYGTGPDSVRSRQRAACAVAERDLNAFMVGR